ncbi:MAG: hypothetical protein P8P74_03970 [Crocinitomicaceae bacterium]|nr:hypothetical protein [Crocinitomicaceae bacterium]
MKHCLCVTSLVLCFLATSQVSADFVATSTLNSFDWTTYAENSELKVEVKRTDCYVNSGLDKQYFLIRLTNRTHSDVTISWNMDLFYNNDCKTCGIGEYLWQIDLTPNAAIVGDCQVGSLNKLRMFSKFIDANYSSNDELTGFHFKNLTIQTNTL